MSEDYLSLEQIASITGFQPSSIRTYLGRAEFTKYVKRLKGEKRYKTFYILNEDFVSDLYDFLIVKKQKNSAESIRNYWYVYQKLKGKPVMTDKELEKKYEIISKQYQSLLSRYKEVLLINKKLNIIEKICQEQADNLAVFDLQKRIKEVINEQYNR